jgi:hypothetical protein
VIGSLARTRVFAALSSVALLGSIAAAQAGPPVSLPPVARPELPLKFPPKPTTAAITPLDLMSRLYVFADDSMQGREAGTPGHVRGTEYIVRELTRLGVKPMGENGSYYQVVPLVNSRLDMANAVLRTDAAALTPGKDFQPIPGVAGLDFPVRASASAVPIVFGGRLGANDAIKADSVKGKLVVLLAPFDRSGRPAFQVWEFDQQLEAYHAAAGVLVATLELLPTEIVNMVNDEQMELKKDEAPSLKPPVVMLTRAAARQLLGFSPDSARVGTAAGKGTLTFAFAHAEPAAPSRNVVAMVEGSDPRLKAQMVAISAHSDHVGISPEKVDHDSLRLLDVLSRPMGVESNARKLLPDEQAKFTAQLDSVRKLRAPRPDSISNGADDDGTGSMGLLELAEYFQSLPQKPKRSILFVWNVAEEKGLYGSEWFTEHPTVPRDSIIADVNIDMIGRGAASDVEGGGPDYVQILGSRRLSTEYGDWIEGVNKRPEFKFQFDYQFDAPGHPQQYYCRSDHWNFARWGIPTVFFSTGSHVDYHMVTDEPEYIDYDHYAKVVQFVGALAADVAARSSRPVVDKPKPDPHGECKQ